MNLAQIIHDSFSRYNDVELPPESLTSIQSLRDAINELPDSDIDPLFKFVVNEAYEGGLDNNGEIDIGRLLRVLNRGISDMIDVIREIENAEYREAKEKQ